MGKNITQQKRGKGSLSYRCPSHRFLGATGHYRGNNTVAGVVMDLKHCPGHNYPLALIEYSDGNRRENALLPAVEGMQVGMKVGCGAGTALALGNALPLSEIPDGTTICCLESIPGNGGNFVLSPGSYGYITSRSDDGKSVSVKLPSGATKLFLPQCRALIGIVAGAGVKDKPLVKAGKNHYIMHARNKRWPSVHPINMNPVDHPYGGGGHKHIGKSQTVNRNTPPGRKVGSVAARKMGRGR